MWTYILVALLPLSMSAQNPANDSLSPAKLLETLPVLGTRLATTAAQAPLSVSFLDKKRIQLATQQLSPYEILGGIPGVFALNADNFSQDLRLSVRGFGARSAFGIRGIRIFTDGLPEGTPDGQADVDNLDMGAMRQLEVLRGPLPDSTAMPRVAHFYFTPKIRIPKNHYSKFKRFGVCMVFRDTNSKLGNVLINGSILSMWHTTKVWVIEHGVV